jgi:hypothetical protein
MIDEAVPEDVAIVAEGGAIRRSERRSSPEGG